MARRREGDPRYNAVLPPTACHREQLERWRAAAEAADVGLAEWVRRTLDRAASARLKAALRSRK